MVILLSPGGQRGDQDLTAWQMGQAALRTTFLKGTALDSLQSTPLIHSALVKSLQK